MIPPVKIQVKQNPKNLEWGELLKKKNPIFTPPRKYEGLACLGGAFVGSGISVTINNLFTDKLPDSWHLPAHGSLTLLTLILPKSKISAGIGGAMFYSFSSELISKYFTKTA